jgi:hypothetical protein
VDWREGRELEVMLTALAWLGMFLLGCLGLVLLIVTLIVCFEIACRIADRLLE